MSIPVTEGASNREAQLISTEDILAAVRPRMRRLLAELGDEGLDLLHKYTGSETVSIGGWLAAETPPTYRLVRVWHLLAMMGVESPEMRVLGELNLLVGRLYALGILNMDEVTDLLKVKNQQTAIQFFRGQTPLKIKPVEVAEELMEKYGARLEAAIAGLPKLDGAPQTDELVATAEGPALPDLAAFIALVGGGNAPLALAMLVGMATPLAQALADGPADGRETFRRLAGQSQFDLLSVLVELLDALRTRAAFDDYKTRTR
jgi:hypothetical protein